MKVGVASKRKVSISCGNSKMGEIPSVSLPAIVTCRKCDCHNKCYAKRMEQRWKNVSKAYQNNLEILTEDPEAYWRQVEASIMMSRFFRFHVSGDIPNAQYFEKMVEVSRRNPHCEILCFTKKYDIVNDFIKRHDTTYSQIFNEVFGHKEEVLPENLHVIFSGWVRLKMDNPFRLPEAHVRSRCGTTTARPDAIDCPGNCTECAQTDGGCWVLKHGEQVVFDEH